jgi:putative PIN family toxin of toxin-antitoxin system
VVDTNVIASALIRPQGTTGQVLAFLRKKRFTIIFSAPQLIELVDVLSRPKIRLKYQVQSEDITALINLFRLEGELVTPGRKINVCRDPGDNFVLEAAVEGKVDAIVTGDADLLSLREFESIPILKVAEFLARWI